jgi:hypothetical protein
MKWLKIIVFAVGSYYILKFLVRLYHARQKMHRGQQQPPVHSANKTTSQAARKPMINPEAGEYTDYEEVKD